MWPAALLPQAASGPAIASASLTASRSTFTIRRYCTALFRFSASTPTYPSTSPEISASCSRKIRATNRRPQESGSATAARCYTRAAISVRPRSPNAGAPARPPPPATARSDRPAPAQPGSTPAAPARGSRRRSRQPVDHHSQFTRRAHRPIPPETDPLQQAHHRRTDPRRYPRSPAAPQPEARRVRIFKGYQIPGRRGYWECLRQVGTYGAWLLAFDEVIALRGPAPSLAR
jgi:hypothetical protein